jgi:hypothetical protein
MYHLQMLEYLKWYIYSRSIWQFSPSGDKVFGEALLNSVYLPSIIFIWF